MSKRTYNQFCPLAFALDIIGERWTLLLVRELLPGPRRFTDLQNGLPGIGTNLLSQRLKDLESYAIIAQRTLPPPAGSTVYELTERGRGLEAVVGSLSMWGLQFLPAKPPESLFVSMNAAMMALPMCYRPGQHTEGTYEIHSGGEVFHLTLAAGQVRSDSGPAAAPYVRIHIDKSVFSKLLSGSLSADEVDARVTFDGGDPVAARDFLLSFQLPTA